MITLKNKLKVINMNDEHNKWCYACREIVPRDKFYKDSSRKDGLCRKCKPCHDKANSKNKSRKAGIKRNAKKRRAKSQKFINRVKKMKGCYFCGYNKHPFALDFDHINPEEKQSGSLKAVNSSWNIKRLKDEIRKCRVVCACCHRLLTHKILKYDDPQNPMSPKGF